MGVYKGLASVKRAIREQPARSSRSPRLRLWRDGHFPNTWRAIWQSELCLSVSIGIRSLGRIFADVSTTLKNLEQALTTYYGFSAQDITSLTDSAGD